MAKVLAVAEQKVGKVVAAGVEAVSAGAALAEELKGEAHALLIGGAEVEAEAQTLGAAGAATVHVASAEILESYHPEGYLEVVERVVRDGAFDVVLLPATVDGKDLAPRLAARLDVPLAQDVTDLSAEEGSVRMVRPVYAGKAFARVSIDASPVIATLRPNAFRSRSDGGAPAIEPVSIPAKAAEWPTEIVSFEPTRGDVPDVGAASIVVAGGRGMKDPGNWNLLEELREALGSEAGLGASRAVVDAGWRPHAEQVGQTGKTVSPRLYFAIGISGAIQHLAGMRTASTIVAVNRDADAPIFGVADYGIVGDLFEVVPRLSEAVRTLKGTQ